MQEELERSPKARGFILRIFGIRYKGWNYSWHVVRTSIPQYNGIVSRVT